MYRSSALLCVTALAALVGLGAAGCSELSSSLSQGLAPKMVESWTETSTETTRSQPGTETQKPAELVIEDEIVGHGEAARPGDEVTVKYSGHLSDGTVFVSSTDAGSRLTFTLGMEDVVTGLSRGVTGMLVGGTRKLTVAPKLGYGAEGNAELGIPPDATLIYEVQLLAVSR